VADVLAQAFAPYRARYTPAAYVATTPDAAEVRRRLDEGVVIVGELGGTIVGTASLVPMPPDTLYLRSVAVRPDAAARGVGTALVEAAVAHAVAQGMKRVELSTTPFLDEAIRLYERLGFERTAESGPPADLHGTPLVTMVRPLDHPGPDADSVEP
jgi:ribosomal protein S18 acetylase RimI-like enzyme